MKASKIAQQIEKTAPLNLAESWDNVGFQLGSRSAEINKVLTTLDINLETVKEAIDKDVDMIVSHHPFFFRKLGNIDLDSAKGKMTEELIKNDITVYSAHTNLDKAEKGLNYYVAKSLGLENIKALSPDNVNQQYYKLIIYGPENIFDDVFKVIQENKLGSVSSNYDSCTFRTEGSGTFRALEGSNPTIGEQDETTQVSEIKLETVVPKAKINQVLNQIKKVHPYEEMAYDLFPIEFVDLPKNEGLGKIGKLNEPVKPEDFIEKVKQNLNLSHLREAGPRPKKVKKVALCTGAGAEFIRTAKNKGADVYLTGDLKYHDGQTAEELKMWTIDAGHFGTEKDAPKILKEILKDMEDIEVIESEIGQDFIREI